MSESSLKRWTDRGLLQVSRTAGGHRRIDRNEAIRFVRARKMSLVRPEILGLPGSVAANPEIDLTTLENPDEAFLELMRRGHDLGARNHLFQRFLDGETIAALADGPIRESFDRIGELWHHGPEGILIEHRATEICVGLVIELSKMVRNDRAGPRAIGGAISGDEYKLPPLLTTAVLQEHGFRAVNLGPNTPIEVFELACFTDDPEQRPDFVWMSINDLPPEAPGLSSQVIDFAARCVEENLTLVVGGRTARELDFDRVPSIPVHGSMTEFAAFVEGWNAERN
ncbi:MAG: hypothetical protein CMJ54_04760 [Planctomycetaceae bacterium]|nr:hypothetical protein [Planctomycetaceae bacterium]